MKSCRFNSLLRDFMIHFSVLKSKAGEVAKTSWSSSAAFKTIFRMISLPASDRRMSAALTVPSFSLSTLLQSYFLALWRAFFRKTCLKLIFRCAGFFAFFGEGCRSGKSSFWISSKMFMDAAVKITRSAPTLEFTSSTSRIASTCAEVKIQAVEEGEKTVCPSFTSASKCAARKHLMCVKGTSCPPDNGQMWEHLIKMY